MNEWKVFVIAGRATFTLENARTGERFTYKVSKARNVERWSVKVLTGPDNNQDYKYIGSIYEKKFRPRIQSMSALWFERLIKVLYSDESLAQNMKMYHMGKCGRCGRNLTVPASIEAGYGPECILHVYTEATNSHISLEDAKIIRKVMQMEAKIKAAQESGLNC